MTHTAIEALDAGNLRDAFAILQTHISDEQGVKLAYLFTAWEHGYLSDVEFRDQLADLLIVGSGAALISADVLVAVYLNRPALGLTVTSEHAERLTKAAATATGLLDTTEDPMPRLNRLAVAEPLDALQQGTLSAYSGHGVTGYTRGLSGSACKLCHWLYKDGYVYPTSKTMHRHPGCTCVPIPVT